MVPDAESVRYAVCEELATLHAIGGGADPYADLVKSVYKVEEVAEILGISRHSVYERVPCIRVGSRRLYPRATLVDVLKNGLKTQSKKIREPRKPNLRSIAHAPALVIAPMSQQSATSTERPGRFTMKNAATMLRLSYTKTKELFDTGKIYSADSYGKRIISREAVEHYLNSGTPLQYVEMLIDRSKSDPYYKDKQELVERFAREMRAKWKT